MNSICYFNSLVQCLLSSKSFINFMKDYSIFQYSDKEDFTTQLINLINKNEPNQSPSEYFLHMLDYFKFEPIAEYVYTINRKCTNCNKVTQSTDKTYSILINDIKEFFESREILHDLSCDNCKIKTDFEQHRFLSIIPPLITMSLNKYFEKSSIMYPYFFSINGITYDLIGTIDHYGVLGCGHYVSRVMRDNKAYLTDDMNITPIEKIECLNETYMLFYERRN